MLNKTAHEWVPVSYTHLDVYKRQGFTHSIPGNKSSDLEINDTSP